MFAEAQITTFVLVGFRDAMDAVCSCKPAEIRKVMLMDATRAVYTRHTSVNVAASGGYHEVNATHQWNATKNA